MTITQIDVWNFQPGFRDGPYVMSHVTQECAYGRILRVHTQDGRRGLGEIVFAPSLTVESREQCIASEAGDLAGLVGQEIDAIAGLADRMRDRGKSWCGVSFGLDTIFCDLEAQRLGCTIADLLGSSRADAVHGYFSISERTADRIRDRMTVAGPGCKVIQLKIGVGTLDDSTAQVTATLDAMTEQQILLADANGGWSVSETLDLIARFDDPRIIWEEPCKTYDDNAAVARASGLPVMVDQCVGDFATAVRAIDERVAASICIKPAFLGGLRIAHELVDCCVTSDMRMRIDGPWCGDIATAAILNLAVCAPSDLLIAGADLREPLVIEPDLHGVVARGDGRLAPPPGPGLGLDLPLQAPGAPDAVYQ